MEGSGYRTCSIPAFVVVGRDLAKEVISVELRELAGQRCEVKVCVWIVPVVPFEPFRTTGRLRIGVRTEGTGHGAFGAIET